jgi:hypothetical protein
VTLGFKSCRTHGHILLSHLRLPQLGGRGARIYIPQVQSGPVIPPGTGFPFVASYDSQGYGGSILTRHHTGVAKTVFASSNTWIVGSNLIPGMDDFAFILFLMLYRSRGPGSIPGVTRFFSEVVGLERGPLSLVSTIEELLERKSSGFGLENREYGRRDPSR